jgi:hypothetical protein
MFCHYHLYRVGNTFIIGEVMSGKSYESYSSDFSERKSSFSDDSESYYKKRKEKVEEDRERVHERASKPREKRATDDLYDESLVTKQITKPNATTERLHIVLIDNSGSNAKIAQHLRDSSGYLMGVLAQLDPSSEIAFMYCSDHSDNALFIQSIDYLKPGEKADKALFSSSYHVRGANGYDGAEAWECALWDACGLDFGKAKEKHLYLVTDVVGHGMGMNSDDGCPRQRDWRKSVEKVYKTFTTFTVVGCGDDDDVGKLQTQFLKEDRVPFDLIDLSSIKEFEHRAAITGNALLFLIARNTGMQGIELFLSFLYEKWLQEPIFGSDTDKRAQDMIHRFGKYIEKPETEVNKLMKKILVK